jgi:hypothetical protein
VTPMLNHFALSFVLIGLVRSLILITTSVI